ncbi:MAG: hypothetical protein B7Y98_01495 [Sphingomonas sp. 32-62-10]|nr:MAG: hypothetical protein B7Y98_01495 [Sphingomonas sp. 32-62-10]
MTCGELSPEALIGATTRARNARRETSFIIAPLRKRIRLTTGRGSFGPVRNNVLHQWLAVSAKLGNNSGRSESGESRLIDFGGGIALVDFIARESLLFAVIGIAIGGIDDLAVDIVFLIRTGWRHQARRRVPVPTLADFAAPEPQGRIVVFVAAWDEANVIGAMLEAALARFDHPNYSIYVGTYPNDPATTDAVAAIALRDARIKLVIGDDPGPTTKAANLNALWHALARDEAEGGDRARAIVLHDAEDVVHPHELRLFDRLIGRYAAVQLPVLPLVQGGSRLISGHYCDEFAESHAKQLVVRQALGVGLPLAGVGCAISRALLEVVAAARGGEPFDAQSLTEDYELGLHVAALGGQSIMARVHEYRGGPVVAVRAYFPSTLNAAVRQKARWMIGIALAGWDRIGWGRRFAWGDHWMRMRDRRGPLAVLVLAAAYLTLVATALSLLSHALLGTAPAPLPLPEFVIAANALLLGWRLAMRAAFTTAAYGWREGLWSVPRALVANIIALLAARRAIIRYVAMLRGSALEWDKTAHVFPELAGGQAR